MSAKPLVIIGSARKDSDTLSLVNDIFAPENRELIDLLDFQFTGYDYESGNRDDDFVKLAQRMIDHEVIVFATPVYWYAMSSLMKTFFDRFSDLVRIRKEMGRQLAGKRVFAVVVGHDAEPPEGYEVPFRNSCNYLDMVYEGMLYRSSGHPETAQKRSEQIPGFLAQIMDALKQPDQV